MSPVLQANMYNETYRYVHDRSWDKRILEEESNLNIAYNKTIGKTPFHIFYGYLPKYKDDVSRHDTSQDK